jgi:hypothetical protein
VESRFHPCVKLVECILKYHKPTFAKYGNFSCIHAVTQSLVSSSVGERHSDSAMDNEPRVDISPQITEALLKQMSDNNWKERKLAVETVEGILVKAGVVFPAASGTLPIYNFGHARRSIWQYYVHHLDVFDRRHCMSVFCM